MRSRAIYIFAFFVVLVSFASMSCQSQDSAKIVDKLEQTLSQRERYFEEQLQKIEAQEQKLLHSHDKRERFEICYRIFNLSRSYKYDIAYNYSLECLELATEIGDENLINRAKACQISTFTSGGLFTEAAKVVQGVNTEGVDPEIRRELYYNIVRYYSDQIDYVNDENYKAQYVEKLRQYTDSIQLLSPSEDYYYTYAKSYNALSYGDYAQAIDVLTKFYGSTPCSAHHNSIITFLLADALLKEGDVERGLEYMTLSVGYDVQAAARENRSIKSISEQLFAMGSTKMAERLIEIAFDDAKFYNARHRNLEVNSLLPIINKHKILTISKQRNALYILSAIISILGVAAVAFAVITRKNSRIIKASRHTIEKQLEHISQVNNLLTESNEIKEHYIIDSLYKSNEHLKQTEQLLKKIELKVKNRLYDDLRHIYKDFNIKREKESFFADFDRAFLNLFPNFIEEYNSLFNPEDRIDTQNSRELPPEVRIFALMRLGITDNERISRFLDLSINTIYTYKTKVKSRSIIPKEEFEKRILQIKLSRCNSIKE